MTDHIDGTVFAEFERTSREYGDNPFLHIPRQATESYRQGPVDFTYAQARQAVESLRDDYLAAGYGFAQRVGLVLENRAEFFLHFLALNSIGASIVPLNAAFPAAEMAYVLGHSDACLVLTLPEHRARVREAVAKTGREIPVIESTPGAGLPAAPPVAHGDPGPATEVALLYTSGTTGKPKGCMLSNEYFLCMGEWYRSMGGYCTLEPGRERLLTPLPLVHMNALASSFMAMMTTGGCLIQLDRFHPSSWWETVRESRASCLHYLGVMPAILLNMPESPSDDFSGQVKFGFGAGSDPRHQARFENRFGFPLIEGWAMTETGTEVCIVAQHEPRHVGLRCIGRPCGQIDYRLVDEEGHDVPPGQPGELLVRAAGANPRRGFFSGYYKDPEATAAAWEGGYFHTGDVVRVGEDGSFYFVDRRKNIVRRSGENIAAVEVEGVLFQHPAVANCAVAPVPDEMRGEEVAVCIIAAEGAAPDEHLARELAAFCRERLSYYKVPAYFLFVSALPMTASQKIQRGEIKQLARTRVEQGDCFDLRDEKKRLPAA